MSSYTVMCATGVGGDDGEDGESGGGGGFGQRGFGGGGGGFGKPLPLVWCIGPVELRG